MSGRFILGFPFFAHSSKSIFLESLALSQIGLRFMDSIFFSRVFEKTTPFVFINYLKFIFILPKIFFKVDLESCINPSQYPV